MRHGTFDIRQSVSWLQDRRSGIHDQFFFNFTFYFVDFVEGMRSNECPSGSKRVSIAHVMVVVILLDQGLEKDDSTVLYMRSDEYKPKKKDSSEF